MSSNTKNNLAQKFNLAFALLTIFLLVLATNLIDKRHFNTAQEVITTVYEDRIVAQHYIYQMNSVVHEKKVNFLINNTNGFVKKDVLIKGLIDKFGLTQLTLEEKKHFGSLRRNISLLERKTNEQTNFSISEKSTVLSIFDDIEVDLNQLANIQVSEGKRRISIAQKSLDTTNLLSNIELGFLIVLGIAIQFVLFYRVKKTSQKKEIE